MINLEICLLKVIQFFKKTNASNKRSIKIFVNKTLHLNPINNKKQVVKYNLDELKYKGDTRTSDVEEIENEAEDDDDDDDLEFNDNGDDDDKEGVDVEIDDSNNDDNDGDGGDNDGNHVEGVTVNGDVFNIKHLTSET